ncbi:Uncharacterized protein FWK35_00019067 [Aphis craccivora]|uniref:Uncharacterized protein n=1 Tax=Aphis craccivora TaxID=307492 RepID=A0A6G0YU42_APHCR|nr:Uncharacterized protein FWK35_00019067 [Aphis craccivora]
MNLFSLAFANFKKCVTRRQHNNGCDVFLKQPKATIKLFRHNNDSPRREKAIKSRFCGKKQIKAKKVHFIKIRTIQNNYLFITLPSKEPYKIAGLVNDDMFNIVMLPALAYVQKSYAVVTEFEELSNSRFYIDNDYLLKPIIDYFENKWSGRLVIDIQHQHFFLKL